MSQELKKRTKKFALNVIKLCAGLVQQVQARVGVKPVLKSWMEMNSTRLNLAALFVMKLP